MKRLLALVLTLAMVLCAFAACGKTEEPAPAASTNEPAPAAEAAEPAETFEKVTLRMSTNGAEGASDVTCAKNVSEIVKEKTGGNVVIEVYTNDQLAGGDQTKGIELVTQGLTDIGMYGLTTSSTIIDERLLAPCIPFNFHSYEEAADCMYGAGGEYVASVMAEKNLHYIAFVHNGMRQFSNNKRPIHTPADMKNLKMRVVGSQMFLDIFNALGADPIVMSWSEVYTGLQQGTIDGQDNPYKTAWAAKIMEVQKYYTTSNYVYDAFTVYVYGPTWDKLSANTQAVITDAFIEVSKELNDSTVATELELKEAYANDYGVEINDLTEDEVSEFKKVLQPIIDAYAEKIGPEGAKAFGL